MYGLFPLKIFFGGQRKVGSGSNGFHNSSNNQRLRKRCLNWYSHPPTPQKKKPGKFVGGHKETHKPKPTPQSRAVNGTLPRSTLLSLTFRRAILQRGHFHYSCKNLRQQLRKDESVLGLEERFLRNGGRGRKSSH